MSFQRIHFFLVENFTGLVKMLLIFSGYGLLLVALALGMQTTVVIMTGEFLNTAKYLALTVVAFYTALGIQKTIGEHPFDKK